MACKHIYKGITYNSKEEFVKKIINPQVQTLNKGVYILRDSFTNELYGRATSKKEAEDMKISLSKDWDKPFYIDTNTSETENQFLQLLNKDNNWVNFFLKSIIQDSAKKGYEKVLFPTGNTASKVEGHTTLEEFKRQKEDRIKELEAKLDTLNSLKPNQDNSPVQFKLGNSNETLYYSKVGFDNAIKKYKEPFNTEITQLKQELERVETEGFGALRPIYNFYENTVTNILNKTFGKDNVKVITDEYGNTWNELDLFNEKTKSETDNIAFDLNIVPSSILIGKLNAATQDLAIRSIASIILNNEKTDSGLSNKEESFNRIVAIGNSIKALVNSNDPKDLKSKEIYTENQTLSNLNDILTNFDAYYAAADKRINDLLALQATEDGYYELLESSEESINQYIDDSVLTEDRKERASKEVKKFLYTQVEIGKNGKPIPNFNLGLKVMVDYNTLYSALQLQLSTRPYDSVTGLEDMINILTDENNNPTIINIGNQLNTFHKSKTNQVLLKSWFTNFSQQHVIYKKLIDRTNKEDGKNGYLNPVLKNADESNAKSALITSWQHNFYNSNSPMLIKEVTEEGYENIKINTEFGKQVLEEYKALINDNKSSITADKNILLTDVAKVKLQELLNSIGVPISMKGLEGYLSNYSKIGKKKDVGRVLALTNHELADLFKRSAGVINEEANPNKDNLALFNNIFEEENTTLKKLANYEYYNVANQFSMAFRVNGKSYYSIIRTTPFSDAITGLNKEKADKILAINTFAQNSRWLKQGNYPTTAIELGMVNEKNAVKMLKDSIPLEFEAYKIALFQETGVKGQVWFVTDTHSDKTTKPLLNNVKTEIDVTVDNNGNFNLSDTALKELQAYYFAEHDRIVQTNKQNKELKPYQKIEGYHGEEGGGNKFFFYPMFNKDVISKTNEKLYYLMYNSDGELKEFKTLDNDIKNEVISLINSEINAYFNNEIKKQKADWQSLGIINGNNFNYFNKAYVSKVKKDKINKLNNLSVVDFAVADYTVNYMVATMETMFLMGDPAQQYKHKENLLEAIKTTFENVSKRNARLMAQREKGLFSKAGIFGGKKTYTVAYAKDISIDSTHINDYLEEYREAYLDKKKEKGTDAQEFTTVDEHLRVMVAYGKITTEQADSLLAMYDPYAYRAIYGLVPRQFTQEEIDSNKYIFNAHKPVQVEMSLNPDLKIQNQQYIKTSSIPIIPSVVEGTPFAEVHKAMVNAKVNRIAFSSGIKIGNSNPQELIKDGKFNDKFFENNSHELNRNAFGIQQDLPYDEDKTSIGEGTQQMKLLFGDLKDGDKIGKYSIKELRNRFNSLHEELFIKRLTSLLERIGVDKKTGVISPNNVTELQKILLEEADSRDYSQNAKDALKVIDGTFRIPLSFNTFSSKIEPVLLSLFTKKLTKFKLPGKSYVQASEAIVRSFGRKQIKELEDVENKSSIIWTSPKHKAQGKLNHIIVEKEKNEKGEIKEVKRQVAQIIIPSYFKGVNMTRFVNDKGFLDTDRVDSKLLEIFGYRVPTQGHPSMMSFEIVGFLPKVMGDVVLVPHEIAIQMGSDYDVDKLFIYTNHFEDTEEGLKGVRSNIETPTSELTEEQIEQEIVDMSKLVVSSPLLFDKVTAPLDTSNLTGVIERLKLNSTQDFTSGISPLFQRNQYFENRVGQFGVGVTANALINHVNSQVANLYIKGDAEGVFFRDKNGVIISETSQDIETNRVNEYTDQYVKDPQFQGLFRLDLVNAYNTTSGKFDGRLISSIISELMGVSVDNAKDKTLGKAGINKQNFNVALLLARTGLDNDFIIPFINQPIIKEYTDSIANLDNIYEITYEKDKKQKVAETLLTKYRIDKQVSNSQVFSIASLEGMLNTPIDANTMAQQIAILEAFLQYDKIANQLTILQNNTNLDVKGLPKSMLELNEKVKRIDTLTSDLDLLGNVENFETKTISGIFTKMAYIAEKAYKNLFIHNKLAFKAQINKVKEYKGVLDAENSLIVKNHLQMFAYTHPDIIKSLLEDESYIDAKQRLLFGESSLANRLLNAQTKYKKNFLVSKLNIRKDLNNTSNPSTIEINNTTSETKIFENNILIEWESMLQSENKELKDLAVDLAKYTLLFSAQQNSNSNLVKYLPISFLDAINFGKTLANLDFNNVDLFDDFYHQFLQHNPKFSKSLFTLQKQLEKNKIKTKIDYNPKYTNIIDRIVFPSDYEGFKIMNSDKQLINPPYGYIKSNKNNAEYLYKLQNLGGGQVAYVRQSSLGVNNLSEYTYNGNLPSAFQEKNVVLNPTITELKETVPTWKKENYFTKGDVQFNNTKAIVSNLLSNPNISEEYKELALLLSNLDLDYNVQFSNAAFARTSLNDKTINFNPEELLKLSNSEIERVILHEVLHSVTLDKVKDKDFMASPLGKKLQRVYDTAREEIVKTEKGKKELDMFTEAFSNWKSKVKQNPAFTITNSFNELFPESKLDIKYLKNKYYGLTSIDEFISETMTNKDFQEELKKIKGVWDKVIDFFTNLLLGKSNTLLSNSVETIVDIIKPKAIAQVPVINVQNEIETLSPSISVDEPIDWNDLSTNSTTKELSGTVADFMKTLDSEEREIFRKLRKEGIIKTKC